MQVLPMYYESTDNLDKWMVLLKNIIDRPVPPELEISTDDYEEVVKRNQNPVWKLKGVASHLSYRIF